MLKKLGKEDLNIVSKCRREKKLFLSESSCVKTITSSISSCDKFGVECYLRMPMVDVTLCDAETEMRRCNITRAVPLIISTECRVGSVKSHFSKSPCYNTTVFLYGRHCRHFV